MTTRNDSGTMLAATVSRARDFWGYYRRYTDTAIHAAATAALTAFGLLIFIDPWFAWLAIASYLLPPAVLYAIGSDAGYRTTDAERDGTGGPAAGRPIVVDGGSDSDVNPDEGDARAGASRGDIDRIDDPDADGTDFDPDRDADADHDGLDRDVDGVDLDFDGPDLDRDG